MQSTHRNYSADFKQRVLERYDPHSSHSGFSALSSQFGIAGDKTIKRWYKQWDGTIQSLQQRPRSGRPRILNANQINKHVGEFIRRNNRKHTAIHYRSVADRIQRFTHKLPSLRTVQRYGKELNVRLKPTIKKTSLESK
jgi:transposase-like protein